MTVFRYLLTALIISFAGIAGLSDVQAQADNGGDANTEQEERIRYMLYKINQIRTTGCRCGRKKMPRVGKLTWSNDLAYSAYSHAEEMYSYNYFSHHSIDNKDIGERLDDIGYKWQFVGENLAEGQLSFEEALDDWMASKSHCMMIMNPDMKEMGLARVGKYWVHHFGTLMPPKTKRVRTHYREG